MHGYFVQQKIILWLLWFCTSSVLDFWSPSLPSPHAVHVCTAPPCSYCTPPAPSAPHLYGILLCTLTCCSTLIILAVSLLATFRQNFVLYNALACASAWCRSVSVRANMGPKHHYGCYKMKCNVELTFLLSRPGPRMSVICAFVQNSALSSAHALRTCTHEFACEMNNARYFITIESNLRSSRRSCMHASCKVYVFSRTTKPGEWAHGVKTARLWRFMRVKITENIKETNVDAFRVALCFLSAATNEQQLVLSAHASQCSEHQKANHVRSWKGAYGRYRSSQHG
jgi:hypothetical protein